MYIFINVFNAPVLKKLINRKVTLNLGIKFELSINLIILFLLYLSYHVKNISTLDDKKKKYKVSIDGRVEKRFYLIEIDSV